jgi:hypothetical protein
LAKIVGKDETRLLMDALKQKSTEKVQNWLSKIEQEVRYGRYLEQGMEGENNNVWREVSKQCVDTGRQKMKANVREEISLVQQSELNL